MKNRAVKLLVLTGLALALCAPLYARDVVPSFTQSGGAGISGWFWLRPSNPGTVTFTFNDGNKLADIARRKAAVGRNACSTVIKIPVFALVTNTENGNGGHSKAIRMTATSEGSYEATGPLGRVEMKATTRASGQPEVKLQNEWSRVGPSTPPGAGYAAKATMTLPDNVCQNFVLTGNLVVTYTYANDVSASTCCPGKYDHHVAFNNPKTWNDPTQRTQPSLVLKY